LVVFLKGERMKVTIAPDFRDLFRPMTPEEFEQAKANNEADPSHERIPPVVVWDGIIIDGHHTHRIRENLRDGEGKPVKIRYAKMEFEDRQAAMAYAIHAQIGRRNLDPSQIAMAIAKLPKGTAGRPAEKNRDKFDPISSPSGNGSQLATISSAPSRDELADEAGIGRRTMQRADKVNEQGAKAVVAAVTAGEVSVSDAAAIVDLPKDEQAKAVKAVKSGKAKTLKAATKQKAESDEPDPAALAKKNKTLAHSYRDKLARAICDYHEVCPNRAERDRLVKLVQGVQLW
jgi:hypothetical protein